MGCTFSAPNQPSEIEITAADIRDYCRGQWISARPQGDLVSGVNTSGLPPFVLDLHSAVLLSHDCAEPCSPRLKAQLSTASERLVKAEPQQCSPKGLAIAVVATTPADGPFWTEDAVA